MKQLLLATMTFGLLFAVNGYSVETGNKVAANVAGKTCMWPEADVTTLKTHLEKHIASYPTTGAIIKETCKKEMPNEFTEKERACFDLKIKDTAKFTKIEDVLTALNVK